MRTIIAPPPPAPKGNVAEGFSLRKAQAGSLRYQIIGRPVAAGTENATSNGLNIMKDREVIHSFVDYLRENGYPGLQVNRYPEDDTDGDIDAIAGPFAIEHTSIDPLPNQRREAHWFKNAMGGLENELPKPPFQLDMSSDYSAIQKPKLINKIRDAIKTWITEHSARLPFGRHILENVPGIPFRLYVTKEQDIPGIFFARRDAPKDDTLYERIRQQLDKRANKLKKYQEPGTTIILLIEKYSIVVMSNLVLYNAIKCVYPDGPSLGVDEIWVADTSIASSTIETSAPIKFLNIYKKGTYKSYKNEVHRRLKPAATNSNNT